METKKRKIKRDGDFFEVIGLALAAGGGLISVLSEVYKDPRDNDKYHLGHGLYLLLDKTIENNTSRFCKLVREDNTPVSDQYFRLGGLSYGFEKKPYASLIVYPDVKGMGHHCVIDNTGKIVFQAEGHFDSLYYFGGVLVSYKAGIYNLLTGKLIVYGNTRIESKNFYFVENAHNAGQPIGVYKINKNTGEYEIFQ